MASFFSRRESTQGTRKIAATTRLAHFYLDRSRRLLHCLNDTARELLREGVPLTAADLERQPLQTLTGEPVKPADLPLVRAWRKKAPQEAQFVLVRPGALPQHLHWSAAPLFSDDNEVIGVLATLSVAPPEPDWQILAGLAHDLRTPLQSLRFLVPLLEHMTAHIPESRDLLARLSSSADRAMSIGLDLLEWCRGPTKYRSRIETTWFPLAPFLHALAAEQLLAAERKSITLTTDLAAAENLEISSDRVRLGRLLSNLLTNAIRYTSAGLVRFSAAWRPDPDARGQVLVLSVLDTGTGISAEDQESIFMPFERGKAAKEGDSGGSGVGLAVVDRLVEDLGLTLDVYSEYGNGSNFELILPPQMVRPISG